MSVSPWNRCCYGALLRAEQLPLGVCDSVLRSALGAAPQLIPLPGHAGSQQTRDSCHFSTGYKGNCTCLGKYMYKSKHVRK